MPVITNIDDLKALHRRRTPPDVLRLLRVGKLDRADLPREHHRLREAPLPPARRRGHVEPNARLDHAGRAGGDARGPRAHRLPGDAARRRRDPLGPRRRQVRRALHPLHHVGLLHRGRGDARPQEAFLVPALRHAGLGLRGRDHRARPRRQLLGPGPHARPPAPRAAAQGPQERPLDAAEAHAAQHDRFTTRLRWSMGMARTPRRTFRNIVGHARNVGDLASLSTWANEQFDPKLDWPKVERIRDKWGGKFVIKGILDPEDARLAVKCGADAIVVSNHGGRQLDGALSSIRVLPSIVRAVKGQTEIWLDSGIRSGQDVLKAIALGADATMIGRAYVHGLGAMGEAGVLRSLEVIAKEMDFTMALCGRRDIKTVDRDILLVPKDFEGDWAENA
ncbi:L-lactate dehydrogenase [Rubellimicrobium mesophilum DSM 19309]|uniref:L-lactate dehydrogenase n=1 Tax=Rubellimicrobium mesophilum DSM 19309 TaxID=442562 RepID=A0A017HKL4_9RHOB|nr:L-lactate dehydrogenase [Rubellimicrobium mesophilum DSM 19309]